MLIDLGRNDVGRIAKIGTVETTEQMKIEKYSHVMHLVSNVVGELKEGYSSIDVLKATHPAGTLSGAPKVRAMEIIDELEPDRRGVYGGAIGYLSWTGNMDLAIAIRTAVIQNKKLSVRAGGGVVFDSDPEAEYQESMNKAQAIIKAIANGINTSKFRLAILPMIIGYIPMANKKALPDIPGKSKKEQAKNPDKIKLMKLGL